MIAARTSVDTRGVAQHYDRLDSLYRQAWGDHLHHGFWKSAEDRSTIAEATIRLLEEVTRALPLSPGDKVVDIGCGYGSSAHWLAEKHQVNVLGLTLSERQVEVAKMRSAPSRGEVTIVLEDWLNNNIPSQSLDAAVSIEALAHMVDKAGFFRELRRTLKPEAPVTISCWLAPDDPSPMECTILRAICQEGRLPHLGTLDEYLALAQKQGLQVVESRDLTENVARTWSHITQNVLKGLATNPEYLRFLFRRLPRERLFLLTLPRLLLAYRIGTIRYGYLHLQAPAQRRSKK